MVRRVSSVVLCGILAAAAIACGGSRAPAAPPQREPADAKAKALADSYLSAYFDRYPDQGTYFGVPGRHHDKLPDNSLESLKVWEDKEDAWRAEAAAIDPASIQGDPVRAAYAIAREALESSIGARVCRSPLWNVSQMTGWHVGFGYLVTIQPVGSDQARREALTRWSALPGYLDTEIANLREGVRLKYTAPKLNVRIVINQIDTLLGGKQGDAPFMSPTAYLLGMLEIRNARNVAQQTLGPRFDMKAFHDRVLEDGAVPITFLSAKIRSWAMIPP